MYTMLAHDTILPPSEVPDSLRKAAPTILLGTCLQLQDPFKAKGAHQKNQHLGTHHMTISKIALQSLSFPLFERLGHRYM